jgi:hypothetical protein
MSLSPNSRGSLKPIIPVLNFLIPGFVMLCLCACSPIIGMGQPIIDESKSILFQSDQPVGQTFIARHDGLQGIDIFLRPGETSEGAIILHLRSEPGSSTDLTWGKLSLKEVTEPGFYRFSFETQSDSSQQYYYALLELEGEGNLWVESSAGNTYLEGAIYSHDLPFDAQMVFRLVYSFKHALWGLLKESLTWVSLIGIGCLLFVIPGLAILALLWREFDKLPLLEKLTLASGISLALHPILILWTDLLGVHLGAFYAWLPTIVGLIVLLWKGRSINLARMSEIWKEWLRSKTFLPDTILLTLIILIFLIRFYAIRSLDAPMWGDSYQHTIIAQLLVDNDGLFRSWQPYVPYETLSIHFGFPTSVALFSWLSGIGTIQATLIVGQILNGFAVVAIYPLALRFSSGNRWAGVGAVLIAGLLSPMPFFYVNWGRYAQLAGLAILPTSLWMLWDILQRKRIHWYKIGLTSFVLAGMMLTYYRMPIFFGAFIIALMVGWGLPNWRLELRSWMRSVLQIILLILCALLLFLPWGINLIQRYSIESPTSNISIDLNFSQLESVLADFQTWRDILLYVPLSLLILALIGLTISLVRKRWMVASIVIWVLVLIMTVVGRLTALPILNLMQNFAILISLYLPVSLLGGWLIGEVVKQVEEWRIKFQRLSLGFAFVGVAILAASNLVPLVNPTTYAMVTNPDLRAMDWIREQTPTDSLFLVEGFRIYDGSSAVGSDAGWWIPLLSDRQNTMPPQYAMLNEISAPATYTQRVVDLVAQLETTSPSSPGSLRLLCDWGITHIYIGQGQGEVGVGVTQLFSPDELTSNPHFKLIYRQDRVYILELNPQGCEVVK